MNKPRNWQEDMKLCGEGVAPFEFIYESRQALPYWLQQYAAAESLIQQKDAEIARLKALLQDEGDKL